MEDWGATQGEIKANISQLKDQMTRILEVLIALESQVSRSEEMDVQAGKATSVEFLPFGLPAGYTPPTQNMLSRTRFRLLSLLVLPLHILTSKKYSKGRRMIIWQAVM